MITKNISFFLLILTLTSCSFSKQTNYFSDSDKYKQKKVDTWNKSIMATIQVDDVLKIDVYTNLPEASTPYNKTYNLQAQKSQNIDVIQMEGYLVDENYEITFPVLGPISVKGMTVNEASSNITKLLVDGNHIKDPVVTVNVVNRKFTVLGEVNFPGTFNFLENKLTLLQAIGYAKGMTIHGKKNKISLIREMDGVRKKIKIDLTKNKALDSNYYYLKNNDIIIVEPNFSKVKSAGFIGSVQSISALASLFLSVTLLIINN